MVGWLSANGFMSSETSASPAASRATIARRVGSASAWKVRLSASALSIATQLYCLKAIYVSRAQPNSAGVPRGQSKLAVRAAVISEGPSRVPGLRVKKRWRVYLPPVPESRLAPRPPGA